MKTFCSLFLLASLLPVTQAFSQSPRTIRKTTPVSEYKLDAVKVSGTQRYTDQDILAACGLQLGQNVGEGDFKEAVQRLGESGLFTDIGYTYSYSPQGTILEFKLADADPKNLVPVRFENFVWFTDDELTSELRRQIPLFKQDIPAEGSYPERISSILQALLEEKRLPGRVDYMRQGLPGGETITGLAYRVMDVDIRIRGFEFPGTAPEEGALLKTAMRRYIGADYNRDALATVAQMDLLPVYLQRGYLKAAFSPSQARLTEPPSEGEIQVDAILPVTPGKVYSTSNVTWKGNKAIPTAQLQSLIHLPDGQPANAVRLQADLDAAKSSYGDQGYLLARIKPEPNFDDEKATVSYLLNVTEGAQFKMGDLEILGVDSQTTATLVEAWELQEGQPYNASYAKKFLEKSYKKLPTSSRWKAKIDETPDERDSTVDVTIKFTVE